MHPQHDTIGAEIRTPRRRIPGRELVHFLDQRRHHPHSRLVLPQAKLQSGPAEQADDGRIEGARPARALIPTQNRHLPRMVKRQRLFRDVQAGDGHRRVQSGVLCRIVLDVVNHMRAHIGRVASRIPPAHLEFKEVALPDSLLFHLCDVAVMETLRRPERIIPRAETGVEPPRLSAARATVLV